MVVPRLASLSVELLLGTATVVSFVALAAGGRGAGRVCRAATLWGTGLALLAAGLTLGSDAVWLLGALRIDFTSQALKILIAAALLLSTVRSRRTDAFAQERTTGPCFRLIGVTALAVAASAGDLLVLWLALDIASAAAVTVVATAGSWHANEEPVRRLAATWLTTSLLLVLGIVLAAAFAGATRFTELEGRLTETGTYPIMLAAGALIVGSIGVRVFRFGLILSRRDPAIHQPPAPAPR